MARSGADTEVQVVMVNGVAKKFWSEVYDLKRPVDEDLRRPRTSRTKKKAVRRVRPTKPGDRAA
ncbi:MAG TPA: hypothetical protein VE173_05010 [Longimicrobiales bacterium]|nr:hypothetical protein [Longimicrobiales bacterium]